MVYPAIDDADETTDRRLSRVELTRSSGLTHRSVLYEQQSHPNDEPSALKSDERSPISHYVIEDTVIDSPVSDIRTRKRKQPRTFQAIYAALSYKTNCLINSLYFTVSS